MEHRQANAACLWNSASSRSAHRDKRNPRAVIVTRDSLRAWIQRQSAIDEECVTMMAMLEFHRQKPRAIGHLLHGMRCRIPAVEISDEADRLRLGRIADEIRRPQVVRCLASERTHGVC